MEEPKTFVADSDEPLPLGMPADPRVSYNPSRLSFDDLDDDLPVTKAADWPAASELHDNAVTATEEVTRGFELRRIIGRGGFGEVWEGVQHSLQRLIAIKRVREDIYNKAREHSRSTAYCEMGFRHEALTTGSLDHPNIVPVYDFGEDENGRPILAMKLVRGKPWDEIMWDDYNDPTSVFLNKHLQIFISVAQAVAFAHSRGVVHRDIKPAQVMVGEFGEVVLMDWGLALVYDRELTRVHETPLNSGVVPTCDSAPNPAGTIAFMAPEQTQNTSINIGPHTDVYLLGGSLYFLLTRTPPHAAPDSKAAFIEAKSGIVDLPHERAMDREIPDELGILCMRALEPDIGERMQTVKELIDGVQAYLTGAGKRRESEALLEEARDIANSSRCNYRELARGLSAVERAAGLWPDNPDVDDVRELLHIRFSRLALRNRDLVLAGAQVERIGSTETRRQITRDIDKRRRYLTSLRWSARMFTALTLLLLVVVSFMAQGLNRRAEESQRLREAAERGESAAIESRRNAEDLVNFLVDDLYESLERLGRLDLIDRVASEANQYYANLPPTGSSDERSEVLRRARALRVLGDVQVKDRTLVLDRPMEAFRESLRLTKSLAERYPDRVDVMAALAASRYRVGKVLVWTGEIESGLDELHAAEKHHKEVHSREPARVDSLLEATLCVLLRAEILVFMGQRDFANSLLRDAMGLLRTLEGFESTRSEARRLRARMAIHAAEDLAAWGLPEEAEEQLAKARQDLQLLAFDNSYDIHRRVESARVESIEAFLEMRRGALESARDRNARAINEIENIIEFSLRNAEWQRNLAEAYIYQAYIEIGLAGDLEAGIEWVSRAVVISRGTAFQDPTNLISQTWLAVTHGIVGTLMQEYDRPQLAFQELDIALDILGDIMQRAPTVVLWHQKRAEYRIVWARALRDTGDFEAAIRMLETMEKGLAPLDNADRAEFALLLAEAHVVRGQCLQHLDRKAEAIAALENALKGVFPWVGDTDPNRYRAMRIKASALLLLEKNEEAADILNVLRERGFVGRELGKLVLSVSAGD